MEIIINRKLSKTELSEIIPKVIYKYRNFENCFHKKIISEQEIYLSKPSEFGAYNDINFKIDYDYVKNVENRKKAYLAENIPESEVYKYLFDNPISDELLKKIETEQNAYYVEKFGVFCGSETYRNSKLWEVFGGKKNGFCVGIDLVNAMQFNDGTFGNIKYLKEEHLPKCKLINYDDFNQYFINWMLSLSLDFEEEQEFRYIETINNEIDRKRIIPKSCIKEIILGENISNKNKTEIIELISENLPNVSIKKLVYSRGIQKEIIIT